MNYTAHNEDTRREMLNSISLSSVDDLFTQIPQQAKMTGLELQNPLSEMEVQKEVKALSKKNNNDYISFLGGGVYNKFIPAAINQVAGRYEFLTAYTPYQAEISQGSLQVMYEYQTMICNLTNMDIANASMYDGATACAEAIMMAARVSKKRNALVANDINPEFKKVIDTYTHANEIEVTYFDELPQNTSDYGSVLFQTPNFYGELVDYNNIDTLKIVCADPSSFSVIEPPVADIMVGDIQTLGIPMSFGGPHAGYMACREKLMRQMPGRLAGKTLDKEGKEAYCLTIQTREQHIKREKATSNICSNQALIALCTTLYLSLLGEKGFKQAGFLSCKNAHILSEKLIQKGFSILNKNFYNEFVVKVDNADEFLSKLKSKNILGGLKIAQDKVLVCATEMNTENEIDMYANAV